MICIPMTDVWKRCLGAALGFLFDALVRHHWLLAIGALVLLALLFCPSLQLAMVAGLAVAAAT